MTQRRSPEEKRSRCVFISPVSRWLPASSFQPPRSLQFFSTSPERIHQTEAAGPTEPPSIPFISHTTGPRQNSLIRRSTLIGSYELASLRVSDQVIRAMMRCLSHFPPNNSGHHILRAASGTTRETWHRRGAGPIGDWTVPQSGG